MTAFRIPTRVPPLERTLGPIVVKWIERELVHGPGDVQGQPITLDREEVAFLFCAYEVDDQGRRVRRRACWSRPKGRRKSEFAAMVACAEGLGPVRFAGWSRSGRPMAQEVTSPFVRIAATEEEQTGNVFDGIVAMLREGAISRVQGLDVGLTRVFLPYSGKIVPVTAKAASKDGGKESFVVFDETHLYVTPELHRLNQTIARNLGKRKAAEPWRLDTTTMYAPDEGSVAENTHKYALAVAAGKMRDTGLVYDHREGGADGMDFEDDDQLRAALAEAYGEAAEWMDLERLVQMARDPESDPSDTKRYFLNRPTRRKQEEFISAEQWDAIADGAALERGRVVCLGADGSRTFDTTVIAWAGRAPDGRVDVDAHIFSVRQDVAHHTLHAGARIHTDDVGDYAVDLFGEFEVDEAAYDPKYLTGVMDGVERRLDEARIAEVEPQSAQMREALQAFWDGVTGGIARHRGDPQIKAHVLAAVAERGEANRIRRVRKRKVSVPIDAIPAMALAYWRAIQTGGVSVYETRGLTILGEEEGEGGELDLDAAAAAYRERVYADEDDD